MYQSSDELNLPDDNRINKRKWWKISNFVSFIFLVIIGFMWYYTTTSYEPKAQQLTNDDEVDKRLSEFPGFEERKKVPTGVFIQSLKFNSSSEVNLSGYIWQTFDKEDVPDQDLRIGFTLPETVESGSNIEPRLAYREPRGNKVVLGWYFEATLKQKFKYTRYPFDHKTVWIRIWSDDFSGGTILVPDFSSYVATGREHAFGYEEDLVLGQWNLLETFFDYQAKNYNTSFGLDDTVTTTTYPELHFNIVIKRRFLNSFVIYILPLGIIACLIFATLLMISKDPKRSALFGVNASGVIGVCSGLFFVVLLSQVQIREQFAGASVVYIEYFYPLMYTTLLAVSANAYLISLPNANKNPILNWISAEDNIHPKLLFWPLLLGSATLITAIILLPGQGQNSTVNALLPHESLVLSDRSLSV